MEQPKEEIVVKKPTYINRETGVVLTSELDIAYYKSLQNDEIIDNLLLGDFTGEGNYIIKKEYLLELIAVKKKIKEYYDDKYILFAKPKENVPEMKFTLQITKIEGGKKLAVLKYIESTTKSDGETKEFLKTVVARYKDEDDVYFMTKVQKVFNISSLDDSEGKQDEETISLILKRWAELKSAKSALGEKTDYLAKIYVYKILAILKNNPEKFSTYVLRNYLTDVEKMQNKVGKPGYFRQLKNVLDKYIDMAKEKADAEMLKKIDLARSEYLTAKKAMQEEMVASANKKKETKTAEKASGEAKKSGSKSASKGGAKPKAKPADKSKASVKKAVNNPAFRPLPNRAQAEVANKNVETVSETNTRKLVKASLVSALVEEACKETEKNFLSVLYQTSSNSNFLVDVLTEDTKTENVKEKIENKNTEFIQ